MTTITGNYSCVFEDIYDNNLWKGYKVVGTRYYFNDIGEKMFIDQLEKIDEMITNG